MKNAPAYVKVYSRLKNEINKGTYPVGGFLPKECELEKIYQVSRTTVRNAVKMLVQEGLVEVRQGSGTRSFRRTNSSPMNWKFRREPAWRGFSGCSLRMKSLLR